MGRADEVRRQLGDLPELDAVLAFLKDEGLLDVVWPAGRAGQMLQSILGGCLQVVKEAAEAGTSPYAALSASYQDIIERARQE